MKSILGIFALIVLYSCTKEANKEVCYTLSERQCQQDPYFKFVKEPSSESRKMTGIKQYFESQGIKVSTVNANAPFNGAVCLACSCPSGISYTISLNASDTAKLAGLGLSISRVECD